MWRNSVNSWGSVAKWLHWGSALLLFAQLALGFLAVGWAFSPTKLELFIWHKSLGLLLGGLVIIRLLWRFLNPVPRLPDTVPPWQQWASRINHWLLYLCLIALPLTGWIINSASNIPLRVFWWFRLPAITAPDKALSAWMKLVHAGLVAALILLLAIHIAAALHHHFVLHDRVLSRMLPGRSR